jgi:hypothetical protein
MNILEQQSLGRVIRTQKKIIINSVYGGSSMKYPVSITMVFPRKSYTRKLKLEKIFPEFKNEKHK